jgi:hypothetical protein
VKLLGIVLAVQVALGITLVALVATDNLPFTGDGEADGRAPSAQTAAADRFDGRAAFALLRRQVEMGPRPAGSDASRRLADRLRRIVPRGRFQEVPGGLRNVIGTVRGRERGYIVVGAHYDTKDIPGFVGANDGASGTAVVAQLARTIRRPRHTIHFIFFDGEEAPRGVPDSDFEEEGLRGSKVAARQFADARAMVLLDFVGDRDLSIPREDYSAPGLWRKLRRAASRARAGWAFPGPLGRRRARRPPALPAPRCAGDRPDRLRLPLLAPHLRRHVRRLAPQRERGRRDRLQAGQGTVSS